LAVLLFYLEAPASNYGQTIEERKGMAKGRNVLTTGEVAKICNVAARTVTKWFDNKLLNGYRIPGSRDRRIPVPELVHFMKKYKIPGHESLGK
jgi:excisionase family DNA binding protein